MGAVTPKFELGCEFVYNAPTPKFHHPVFTRSEVIMLTNKQTNKQTPLKTSNTLRYATTLDDNSINHGFTKCYPVIDLLFYSLFLLVVIQTLQLSW